MRVFVTINNAGMNDDKCRCEYKELIDKGGCDKGFIWRNPSNYEWECDKSCDTGENLEYENCKFRKKLVDKLVEECTKNVDEVKTAIMALFEHENECVCFNIICVVLAVIVITISIGIGAYFVYSPWYLKKDVTRDK